MAYKPTERCRPFKHEWRTVDPIRNRGTIMQQCRRCQYTREINPTLRFMVGVIVVALLGIALLYWLSTLQQ